MYSTAFLDIPALASAGGSVQLPGSKSISNRVLLLAALSSGTTTVHDLLDSDDTRVMLQALRAMGCSVAQTAAETRIIGMGVAARSGSPTELFLGNAGTAMRPLTAALALLGGEFTLDGVARMRERPIGDLVDALRQLGCQIDYLQNEGYPPLRIAHAAGAPTLNLSEPVRVRGDVSSQFLTALLMALPLAAGKHDVVIDVVGELISKPYIAITLSLLARFGIEVRNEGWQRFIIPTGSAYRSPGDIHVEADASSASYFIALGAIAESATGQKGIRIDGVGLDSIQGDIRFVDAARAMGAQITGGPNWLQVERGAWPLRPIDLDCNHIPDAAMTLAVMALYASGPTTLRNIASWRVKETDRIAAMATELRKLGASVDEGQDFLRITPPGAAAAGPHQGGANPSGGSEPRAAGSVGAPSPWRAASIHTYDDHRVAMCFSLAAFNPAGLAVRIEDPRCVAKTFPDYFEALFSVVQPAQTGVPVICVDGPTASGKGTIAARVAHALGYHLLDSGSIYRVAGLAARRAGIEVAPENEMSLAALARDMRLRFNDSDVLLGAENVTEAIRTEQAGMDASRISALPQVRTAVVDLQLQFRTLPGLVADGRDMGTVIFPGAPLKVYLTASAAKRAERRHQQLLSRGMLAKIADLRADLEARDARDMSRSTAPLKPAPDALVLDNSELTIEQAVAQVLDWWQQRQPFAQPAKS